MEMPKESDNSLQEILIFFCCMTLCDICYVEILCTENNGMATEKKSSRK